MKSKKALLNVIINTAMQFINVILSVAVRKIFLEKLGDDVLGLNSVFSSILAFLTITELGIGVSIATCLYKPLAEEDNAKVNAYMQLLKRVYSAIGCIILICGAGIAPFIHLIVDGDYSRQYIIIAFGLYLFSTAVTYFFAYKKVLLGADQKSYIVSAGQMFNKIVLCSLQIVVLLCTENYYLFLVVNIVCNVVENIVLSKICDKQYPYIKGKATSLSAEEKSSLIGKVKGLVSYKISNYLIEGTDNIIISAFLGTAMVAYYGNYYLVINILFAIFACFGTSAAAGLGNILYSNKEELRGSFLRLMMLQHIIFSFSATALLVLVTDFVKIFFGSESMLSGITVILMTSVYYVKGYSQGIEALRTGTGQYEKDKYINLVVALLNVILSVILVPYMGISGVLVGTLLCYGIKELIVVPLYVVKDVYPGMTKEYMKNFIAHTSITIFIMIICGVIHQYLFVINEIITWFLNGICCLVVSMGINLVIYGRTPELKQLVQTAKKIVKRKV